MLRFHQFENLDGYKGLSRRGAEDAGNAGEGIGFISFQLYCFGFTKFIFQMDAGNVLAKAPRRAARIYLVFEFITSILSESVF